MKYKDVIDTIINHKEALAEADYKKANSNLARCYLDLSKRLAPLEAMLKDGFLGHARKEIMRELSRKKP